MLTINIKFENVQRVSCNQVVVPMHDYFEDGLVKEALQKAWLEYLCVIDEVRQAQHKAEEKEKVLV